MVPKEWSGRAVSFSDSLRQRLKREEKSFFNISGIQRSSHNLIRAEIISYLPPITKLTPMLTLSSCCISVSPKGQGTAWE